MGGPLLQESIRLLTGVVEERVSPTPEYSLGSKLSKSSVFCVLRQSSVGLKSGTLQPGSRANVNAILQGRIISNVRGEGASPCPWKYTFQVPTLLKSRLVWSAVVSSLQDASPRGRGARESNYRRING